jgi:hypothetical protein
VRKSISLENNQPQQFTEVDAVSQEYDTPVKDDIEVTPNNTYLKS